MVNIPSNLKLIKKKELHLMIYSIGSGFKEFIVSTNCDTKIKNVKMEIQFKTELIADEQVLCYQGEILEDEKGLNEYEIIDHSVIHIIGRLRGGMKIFIETPNENIFSFLVENCWKIIDLKLKIKESIGIKFNNHVLLYKNEVLNDTKSLDQYKIVDKSLIFIKKGIKIVAKVNGNTMPIYVQKSDKISDLKMKIYEIIGINPDEQNFYFEGKKLYDFVTVKDNHICEGDTIDIYSRPRGSGGGIKIDRRKDLDSLHKRFLGLDDQLGFLGSFQSLRASKIGIKKDRDYSKSLESLHKKVKRKVGFQKSSLFFNINLNMLVKQKRALKSMKRKKTIKIYIITTNGMKYELFTTKSMKISEVKINIQKILNVNVNEQKLFYNGLLLDDDNKTISACQISEGSEINVKYQLQGWIQIYFLISNGEKLELSIKKTDKIGDIKLHIQTKTRIHKSAQNLSYNDTILSDEEKSVDEYQVENESVINVKFKDQNILQCEIDEFDDPNIKRIIYERFQWDRKRQKLIIYSKQLKDNKLLYEFFIMDKSEFRNDSKFHLFIKGIKLGFLINVCKYYEKTFLEIKHGLYSRSPLLYACKLGHENIVKYIIENECDLESFDFEQRRALHYAVISNNKAIIKLLIDKHADINASDSCGRMPIHLACQMNNVEAAQLLIENNCGIYSLDQLSRSPLEIAEKGRFETLINLLKEYETIRKMAQEMRLKCCNGCKHEFCYKSFQCKDFVKGVKIGHGAYGKVYLCNESKSGRKFVVKKIMKSEIQYQYIEANINEFKNLIRHKKIIKYFGSYLREENDYIFMKFLGCSLDEKMKHMKTNSPIIVLSYIEQILDALKFLHERNIIHRDIKPDNILIGINENVKLTDFGYSLLLSSVENEIQKDPKFYGTGCHMAPEIMNGESYSFSADIWSLGVTVIEMSTGKRFKNKCHETQFMYKVMENRRIEYEIPKNMPRFMKGLIDKMLEPDKLIRANASELLKIIHRLF